MRTTRTVRQARVPPARQSDKDIPVIIVPRQSGDAIQQRRSIRETFHDSKALTVGRKTP